MKIDERHSGPMILGSIIKDPPTHTSSRTDFDYWLDRQVLRGLCLKLHESVRYPSDTNDD